jgi:hypothetical protein
MEQVGRQSLRWGHLLRFKQGQVIHNERVGGSVWESN